MNKWYVIGGVIFALIFFLFGWFVKQGMQPDQPAKIEITERVVIDTLYIEKEIHITDTKTIVKIERDTVFANNEKYTQKIYTDSLEGNEQEVSYKISHTIIDSDSIYSFWDVDIKPLEKRIVEFVSRDSTITMVEYEYVTPPFFLNNWFYVSMISWAITMLAIIF